MTAAHDGGPGHGPAGHQEHAHPVAGDASRRWLSITLGLIVAFMAAEVAAGLLTHSLALLSDARTCSPTRARSSSPRSRCG